MWTDALLPHTLQHLTEAHRTLPLPPSTAALAATTPPAPPPEVPPPLSATAADASQLEVAKKQWAVGSWSEVAKQCELLSKALDVTARVQGTPTGFVCVGGGGRFGRLQF